MKPSPNGKTIGVQLIQPAPEDDGYGSYHIGFQQGPLQTTLQLEYGTIYELLGHIRTLLNPPPHDQLPSEHAPPPYLVRWEPRTRSAQMTIFIREKPVPNKEGQAILTLGFLLGDTQFEVDFSRGHLHEFHHRLHWFVSSTPKEPLFSKDYNSYDQLP